MPIAKKLLNSSIFVLLCGVVASQARATEPNSSSSVVSTMVLPEDQAFYPVKSDVTVTYGTNTSGEFNVAILSVEGGTDTQGGCIAAIGIIPHVPYVCVIQRGDACYYTASSNNPLYGLCSITISLYGGFEGSHSHLSVGGNVPENPLGMYGDINHGPTNGAEYQSPFDPLIQQMMVEDLEKSPIRIEIPTNPSANSGITQTTSGQLLGLTPVGHVQSVKDLIIETLQEANLRQQVFNSIVNHINVACLTNPAYEQAVMAWIRAIRQYEIDLREWQIHAMSGVATLAPSGEDSPPVPRRPLEPALPPCAP